MTSISVLKIFFSKKIELIFGDLFLLKTKSIYVGIVYGPPKVTNILQFFAEIPRLLKGTL